MFSANTWSVFRYELRRNLTRAGFLFTTFGLPAIALAVYFFITVVTGNGGDGGSDTDQLDFDVQGIRTAGYVDQSGLFADPGEFASELMKPYESVEAARNALEEGRISVYYVIAEDYAETGDIELYLPEFAITQITSAPIRQLFYSQLLDAGVDQQTVSRFVSPASIEGVQLERAAEGDDAEGVSDSGTGTVVVLFAFLLTMSLFSTNGYLMQTVIEEKESRLVEILLSSVRPGRDPAGYHALRRW